MMSSAYSSDLYTNADLVVGMEMDMEVKSEPNSDDDFFDSAESITSSVEEVPVTNSLQYESDEELEDEPLVEIDSITVPQELVKVELEPSLLLFVNRDSTKYTSSKLAQASVNVHRNTVVASVKEKPISRSIAETDKEEMANRKSITKALRNVKRKHKIPIQNSSELYSNNSKFDISEATNVESGDKDENCCGGPSSPFLSSSENASDRAQLLLSPLSNRKNKNKVIRRHIKPKKKQICHQTKQKTLSVHRNKIVAHKWIDESILSSLNKKNEKELLAISKECGGKENNSEELKKETMSNNENKQLVICKNNKKPMKRTRLQRKIFKKDKELVQMVKPESFDCTICGKKFREKSHLATHSRAHIDIRNYKCNECGNLFKTKTNLFFHMKTHEEAPFICEKCNKIYPERKMLMRHIRVVHSGEGNYNCDQCGRSFKSAHNLDLHYTLHTGNKPFSCNVCSKSFVYKSTYTAHMKAHDADDSFNCDLCPSNISNKGELRRRCNHHSEARPWLCTVCGKGYPLKGTLKNHMKTHEPEKPFKCNQCGKAFMKKQSFECHMKIHAGENPQYMCDQCSQSYFNVFALKRHYMKHTSERRFVCDMCNKAFWMKDALKVHKRSHANVKMFHCTQCSKAFAHKHTLVAHLRTHSSEQPYSCTLCPKTFIHKYNLDRHERQHSMPPPQATLPVPSSLVMMAPPKHLDLPTLHIL